MYHKMWLINFIPFWFDLNIFTFWLGNLLGAAAAVTTDNLYVPEQVHLAFGNESNNFVVMTEADTDESIVNFGTHSLEQTAYGSRVHNVLYEGENDTRSQWVHKVELNGLQWNTSYMYTVGSHHAWSDQLKFRTPPAGEDWIVRVIIYGDLGTEYAHSLPSLKEDVKSDLYNFVLHVGDFAYDLDDDEGRVGDQFFRNIQPVAARVPYMVCTGNHEVMNNFTQFKSRFSMPGQRNDNFYYSWDLGTVHFVAFSTEFYYNNSAASGSEWWDGLKRQFAWLKEDLSEASKPENREKRPWIIAYGHRPMYCSSEEDECLWKDVPQRQGANLTEPGYGLEPLLAQYGVDLTIFGHEHAYERFWPLYDHKVYNGSIEHPYVNPKAPVHLITGSAGCKEKTYPIKVPKPWTAFKSSDYGYTKFTAFNKSHLYLEQISVDQKGQVIDSFWLVRENHDAYDFI